MVVTYKIALVKAQSAYTEGSLAYGQVSVYLPYEGIHTKPHRAILREKHQMDQVHMCSTVTNSGSWNGIKGPTQKPSMGNWLPCC